MKYIVYLTMFLIPMANESIAATLYMVEIAVIAAIFVFPFSQASRNLKFNGLDQLVMLYAVFNLLSVAIGVEQFYESARHFRLHVVTPCAIYFIIRFGLKRIEEYEAALFWMLPLSLWQGVLLIRYFLVYGERPVGVEGAASTITLGVVFAMGLFLCFYCRFRRERQTKRLFRWALLAVLFIMLLSSFTRATMIGFVLLSVYMFFMWQKRSGRKILAIGSNVSVWLLLVVIFTGSIFFADVEVEDAKEKQQQVGRIFDVSLYMSDANDRITFWSKVVEAAMENPVFGSGSAQYNIGDRGGTVFNLGSSHNYLVSTLVTSGLIGLGILLCIIWKSYSVFFGRYENYLVGQNAAKFLITSLTVLMMVMVSNDLTGGRIFIWFFTLGMISKMHQDSRGDFITHRSEMLAARKAQEAQVS